MSLDNTPGDVEAETSAVWLAPRPAVGEAPARLED